MNCPRCGAQLLPADQGYCPICRRSVNTVMPVPTEPVLLSPATQEWSWTTGTQDRPSGPTFDPAEETLFQQVCHMLRTPEKPRGGAALWLIVSLVLFVLFSQVGKRSLPGLAIVVGVLFFHEAGHWLGMQLFGYRDVKMFFIPFFGAAVSGRKEGAPGWQQAIVALLGPLPGIVLGCALLAVHLAAPNPLLGYLAGWLVGLNAFNLLPLVPLDGGRFLNVVVFSRHRVLEVLFLVGTSLLIAGLGLLMPPRSYILIAIGLLGVFMAPARYRIARAAEAIVARWPVLPPRIGAADEPMVRDLFREARTMLGPTAKPSAYATTMTAMHERALVQPVSLAAALGLIALYAMGFVLALAAGLMWAVQRGAHVAG